MAKSKTDIAWARRVLANRNSFDYARDPDGHRVGRTKYIMLSWREAQAIRAAIPTGRRLANPERE